MKAIVFHGIGDIGLDNASDPQIQHPLDAVIRITASAIYTEQFLTQEQPLTSAIDAYKSFERHATGWIKVKLDPAGEPRAGKSAA